MAVLNPIPLIVVVTACSSIATACYSPEVRDCTVACSTAADCAPDQVCGDHGLCAAASAAGTCATTGALPSDATTSTPRDTPTDPRADASLVRIFVRIDGRGVVTIPNIGNCDAGSGHMDCMFEVANGTQTTLHATPKHGWRFDAWDGACEDALTAACLLAPTTDVTARARFVRSDDD